MFRGRGLKVRRWGIAALGVEYAGPCAATIDQVGEVYYRGRISLRRRRLLPTTKVELKAMAPAARMGTR